MNELEIRIGVIGSRKRDSGTDKLKLFNCLEGLIDRIISALYYVGRLTFTIVTGDCNKGGDKFAKEFAEKHNYNLEVKRIKDPATGEEMDFKIPKRFSYYDMVNIYYARNKELAESNLDYLVALGNLEKNGGTENTIAYFLNYNNYNVGDRLVVL